MKVLFFLFLVFSPSALFANLNGKIEIGHNIQKFNENRVSYAFMETGYDFYLLKLRHRFYGSWRTWFYQSSKIIIDNKPFRDIYTIGYKAKYDIVYFKVQHFCNHPVLSDYDKKWFSNRWGQSATSFSIGLEWELK